MTSRFAFLHWLFVGGINPLAELGWAERRKHLLCLPSPLLLLRRRRGEGRGGGSGMLRALSPTHRCKHTRQDALRSLLTSSAQSKQMRRPCMHASSGVPAYKPACVPHDTLKDGQPRSLHTFLAHWRCRRRRFLQGSVQEWCFSWGSEVVEEWHHQVCVFKAAADMKPRLKWLNRSIDKRATGVFGVVCPRAPVRTLRSTYFRWCEH